jgi:nucleoside 2-deoxyribosyltransferase
MKRSDVYSIYFAGPLFKYHELIANAHTARFILELSSGRYQCVLPQDLEQTEARSPISIRDQDLYQVMVNDLIIANFDGAPVDDGTVVEFIRAKDLDIPTVLTRSDFRLAGDGEHGDPWNLMMSGFPRTEVVTFHAMAWYQEEFKKPGTTRDGAENHLYSRIAAALIEKLDAVRALPPVFETEKEALMAYRLARKTAGPSFIERTADLDLVALIEEKRRKGLL